MENIIFVDTETTGKEPHDRVIQICSKVPGQNPSTVYFKPNVPINFEAMAVHHITEDMVKDEPTVSSLAEHYNRAFHKYIFIAHNAKFDIDMLAKDGITVPRYICTLKVCQWLFDEPSYKLQYFRYKYNLNVEARAHDAEGDVIVLEALFNFLLTKATIEQMLEISNKPTVLRRMPFGKHQGKKFEEIPRDYLSWLQNQELTPDLRYTVGLHVKGK